MRVIFLQDVPKVAKAGEAKDVADGYGRNFLLPRKLAVVASPEALNRVKVLLEKEARQKTHEETELTELAKQLDGKEITLKARAGSKERLYGAITSTDIAAELERATGLIVDKRKVDLEEPIRQIGDYEVAIKLTKDLVPRIRVKVTEEETA